MKIFSSRRHGGNAVGTSASLASSLLLFLLVTVSSSTQVNTRALADECMDSDIAAQCATENRECTITSAAGDSDGTSTDIIVEGCGDCVEGYVEWQGRTREAPICFKIDDVKWQDFLDAYAPNYVASSSVSNEERLTLLLQAIQFIIEYRASLKADNSTTFFDETNNITITIPPTFELGLTPFSADSVEEFKQRSGFIPRDDIPEDAQLPVVQSTAFSTSATDGGNSLLPEKVDWVEFGAVTSVKDQGRCGCCWSVSLAGAIEGSAFIQNEYLQSISNQHFISCNDENLGCDGGNLVLGMGYAWLNNFGGMTILNDYPYTDYSGDTTEACELEGKNLAVTIQDPKVAFDTLPVMEFEDRLNLVKSILAAQPISISMKSACRTLSNYRKGIMTDDGDCACLDPYCADHAVLMVGYDDTTDPPSIKIKNSWGTNWGEDGYFRVSQQQAGPYGLFGVLGHGVIAGTVTNTTVQVEEDEPKERLATWAIILIIVAAVVVCMGCAKAGMGAAAVGGEDDGGAPAAD